MVDDEVARAFVPGHVTGFFSVHHGDDPLSTGSRGGGLTLADGVTVTVSRGEHQTYLDGTSSTIEPVDLVCSALDVEPTVSVESALPPGCGFGVSGGAALGTAMAANSLYDLELSENEVVALAHGAEVRAGTGLGDVVAQARGGAVLRLEPGAPGRGALDGIPIEPTVVEYLVLDERSTTDVLTGDTTLLSEAGEVALRRVRSTPTTDQFVRASRRFAREAELLTPDVIEVIQAVSAADGEAAMAMLGETVFTLGTGLTEAGYDPVQTRVDHCGATMHTGAETENR